MSLENLIRNNQYPILFLGSGISKRYLENFQSWSDLLKSYWDQLFEGQNYYAKLHELTKNSPLPIDDQNFDANVQIADLIQVKFDDSFFQGLISVDGLSLQEAQERRLSPFKVDLARKLKKYDLKNNLDQIEFQEFISLLCKARIIVTTNYDTLVEDLIKKYANRDVQVYVGQKGLFDETMNWSEIYKIHGSVTLPESIVITKNDYAEYDKHSILISAKILSSMISSPIIFLGYSLTDRNVRKLLKDFSSQLPEEDTRKSANRILVIEFQANQEQIKEEIINDKSLNFTYTSIKTDNYTEIYRKLNTINEGATPAEIQKYNSLIKKLIVTSGQKGTLKSVLVSAEELGDINKQIDKGKHIVVAMGDSKQLYVYPDYLSFVKDYFEETGNYLAPVALKFVAHYSNKMAKIPFSKFLKDVDFNSLQISQNEIDKLNSKIECNPSLDGIISKLSSKVKSYKIKSIQELKNTAKSQDFAFNMQIKVLIANVKSIPKRDTKKYIISEAIPRFALAGENGNNTEKSDLRSLFLAYDLLANGDMKKITTKKPS